MKNCSGLLVNLIVNDMIVEEKRKKGKKEKRKKGKKEKRKKIEK
ncbi:hypothetical protein [Photorhabdus khanii]|nr:hypothetical protein [Photorhabdus khanii]